jgi:hypothetical protein
MRVAVEEATLLDRVEEEQAVEDGLSVVVGIFLRYGVGLTALQHAQWHAARAVDGDGVMVEQVQGASSVALLWEWLYIVAKMIGFHSYFSCRRMAYK